MGRNKCCLDVDMQNIDVLAGKLLPSPTNAYVLSFDNVMLFTIFIITTNTKHKTIGITFHFRNTSL